MVHPGFPRESVTARWVLITVLLPLTTSIAQARPNDWQAELEHCRALHENVIPLLPAGKGQAVARSAVAMRRCVWIERRAEFAHRCRTVDVHGLDADRQQASVLPLSPPR
jgi:hypothetical protein